MRDEIIQERAEIIFDQIEYKMNYGFEINSSDYLDAYKATFALKSKSISLYKRAFKDTSLDFCILSVEAVYEELCDEIPGPKELTSKEKEILRELLRHIESGSGRAFL